MVLHLRKIISVLSALIIMMSASPVFALQKIEGCDEEMLSSETMIADEPQQEETKAEEKTPENYKLQNPEKKPENIQSGFAYLTLFDEENVKLIDNEKIEFSGKITVIDFVEKILEENSLKYDWEELKFEYNGQEIEDDNFKSHEIISEDILIVSIEGIDQVDSRDAVNDNVMSTMATETEIDNAHKGAVSRTSDMMDGSGWTYGNEWGVIGVSRFTTVAETNVEKYCSSLATYIDEIKTAKLSETKSSDNARTILALTSLGYDPTDVNGYNLLEPLADFEYASQPYLSGPIWTLLAIDSHGYSLPEAETGKTQTTRELLVDTILNAGKGAGWAYSGTTPDVDMTCMAIQALAPYREDDARVNEAIENALTWLSQQQDSGGGYISFGNETSESASQVIAALTAVGIDPNTDSRFIKNGNSVMDSLLKYKTDDGGFFHLITDIKANTLATYEGCYSLTAYFRFITGKTSLFNMNDLVLRKFDAKPVPGEKKGQEDGEVGGNKTAELSTAAATGKTFSLGGKTIKVGASEEAEDQLGTVNDNMAEMGYNSAEERQRLVSVLPWIYGGIAALAALALVIILRNRKPE